MSLFHHHSSPPEGFVKSEDLASARNQDIMGAADTLISTILLADDLKGHPWGGPDNQVIALGLATIARSQRVLADNLLSGEEEANQSIHDREGLVHELVYNMGAVLLRASTQHIAHAQSAVENPRVLIDQPIRDEFVAENQLPEWMTATELPRTVLASIDTAYQHLQGWSVDLQKRVLNSPSMRPEDTWYADMLKTQFTDADTKRNAGAPFANAIGGVNAEILQGAYEDLHVAYAGLMQATIYTMAARVASPEIVAA